MAFNPPKFEEIRDNILRDIKSLNPEADTAIDSDYFIRASSIAVCCEGQYAHQSWIVRQIFPDTADTEFLEWHAATRDIYRKNATFATGLVRIYGVSGSIIRTGLGIKSSNVEFQTTEQKTIETGKSYVDIAIIALSAGTASNTEIEREAILTAAPAGCRTECTILSTLGGTNQETDGELLERLLERIRRPPAGGNKYDYRNWALSVEGVTNAYVYPLRRGLGTVDIAITSGNNLPSAELIERVQSYIDDVRPVTAKESRVIAPTPHFINFVIKISTSGITLEDSEKEIQTVLDDYFLRLAPADFFILSQVEALISDIVGIVDRKIILPTANLIPDLENGITWFRLGSMTVSQI